LTDSQPKAATPKVEATPGQTQSALRYPDFFCIGAQKAGTTWLHENLRFHPKVWLAPVKELHYFNHLYLPWQRAWTGTHRRNHGARALHGYLDTVKRADWDYRHIARVAEIISGEPSDEWYGKIFSVARPEQLCGEITPEYSILPPEGIEHVLRLSPNAKFVMMLRDPVDRNWSHIRMNARKDATLEDYLRIARYNDVVDRSNYPRIIRTWTRFVPADRFKVVFMDDIVAQPRTVMADLCGFLGLDYEDSMFTRLDKPVHVGAEQEIPPEVLDLIKTQLQPIYTRFCEMYPDIGNKWRALHY
jgi:hypothetical protein